MLPQHAQILQTIGEKLRALRQAKGLSMNIARDIRANYGVKIDSSYLSRIERGKTEIPLRTLFALADYFEVHPCSLLENVSAFKKANNIDFISLDPNLVNVLIELKEKVGEQKAREYLRNHTNSTLTMMREISPGEGLELKAARPEPDEEPPEP